MDSAGVRTAFALLVVGSFSAIHVDRSITAAPPETELGFPICLYHVHVNRGFPVDKISDLSKEMGIQFGVVDNFGRHYGNYSMDRYTDYLVDIASEPIDIIANLTYLPERIRDDYEELWSQQRTMRIIRAAVENDVAIEINSTYRIPSMTFLRRAKAAGAKFAFGANSHNANDTRDIDYCIKAAKELRLTRNDMFVPAKAKKITTHE